YQKNRHAAVLCQQEKLVRDFPHLRNRTGCRFDRAREHGLNRVDEHRAWIQAIDLVKDLFEIGFGKEVEVLRSDAESIAAQLDLAFRLLAGNVQHDCARAAESIGNLKQKRALADTRIAAAQDQRTRHDSA